MYIHDATGQVLVNLAAASTIGVEKESENYFVIAQHPGGGQTILYQGVDEASAFAFLESIGELLVKTKLLHIIPGRAYSTPRFTNQPKET